MRRIATGMLAALAAAAAAGGLSAAAGGVSALRPADPAPGLTISGKAALIRSGRGLAGVLLLHNGARRASRPFTLTVTFATPHGRRTLRFDLGAIAAHATRRMRLRFGLPIGAE